MNNGVCRNCSEKFELKSNNSLYCKESRSKECLICFEQYTFNCVRVTKQVCSTLCSKVYNSLKEAPRYCECRKCDCKEALIYKNSRYCKILKTKNCEHCKSLFKTECNSREVLYCSAHCAGASVKTNNKRVETVKRKYGVNSTFNLQESRSKSAVAAWSEEAKLKRTTTMLSLYGVDNVMKNKEASEAVLNKQRENNHGGLAFNSEKQKLTMVSRYGFETPAKNSIIKEKIKDTQFRNNAGNFAFNTPKQRETMIERYGAPANGLLKGRGGSIEEDSLAVKLDGLGFKHNKLYTKEEIIKSFTFSDGKVKIPDFYHEEAKIVLEYNGSYWHKDPYEAEYWLQEWSKLGYQISIIWDFERNSFLTTEYTLEELTEEYPCSYRKKTVVK